MIDEENQEVFVESKNFNCKRCGKFPQELTIFTCHNIIEGKECGFNYCPSCAKSVKKCNNYKCGGSKNNITENQSISRLLRNGKRINTCNFCGANLFSEEELKKHISLCRESKYSCKYCNFCENDKEKFWQHMISEHKSIVVSTLDENNN